MFCSKLGIIYVNHPKSSIMNAQTAIIFYTYTVIQF